MTCRGGDDGSDSLRRVDCDENVIIDDILSLAQVDQYYIHLQPTAQSAPLKIISSYKKLDVMKAAGS